ncbi:hypothetical protein GCK72_020941 [Caenorhabditis remanei]|uniref:Peptidase A1 domain-containing protein n=1 Tax=Caenorhabditis remanei TaxID=31234 RepID=A0A6A5GGU2_CAERE|nr:hypothetical protein GCK72_020941 [Caenorhabditis remanei]KAF1754380.1 hypothetical protein GCK72_020941 [Caenorhabditis remanei]
MPKCLIVFFALLGLASAVKFSVPLRSSGSLKEKMVREGRYSEYLMQRNSAVRQNLVDTMDEFYVADIALGTPAQHFTVSLDTGSSVIWVLDSHCDSQNCHEYTLNHTMKSAYNNETSSTFVDANKNFLFYYSQSEIYGLLGKEKVSFSGFSLSNQDFIRATVLPDVFTQQPIDGVFGLGWAPKEELTGVGNPMQALLPQLDQPMFSIWMQRNDGMGSAGAITFGGFDNVACDKNIQYLPLAEPGVWGFTVDSASIGIFTHKRSGKAISASGSGWTGIPDKFMPQVIKATKAKYDWNYELYYVPCSTAASHPDIKLHIGGNEYHITSAEYVLDIGLGNDKCVLAIFVDTGLAPEADWILGDAFIRRYCQIYDFGNSRMGLSKFIQRD